MKSNHENTEYSLIFTPEAQSDIDDILQYTISEWGQNQAEKYKDILGRVFSSLQYNPGLGHLRPDIPPEYKAYQAGQHIVIFRVRIRQYTLSGFCIAQWILLISYYLNEKIKTIVVRPARLTDLGLRVNLKDTLFLSF